MKNSKTVLALVAAALTGPALAVMAQEAKPANPPARTTTPAKPADGPAPAAAPATVPGGESSASTAATAFDYLFNRKAQDGTAAKSAANLGGILGDKLRGMDVNTGPMQDPLMRAHFEKFLGTAEVPADQIKAYEDLLAKATAQLRGKNAFDAWKTLFVLSDSQSLDAGISRELANRVETIWNMGRTNSQLARLNDQLQEDVQSSGRSADLIAETVRTQVREETRKDNDIGGKGKQAGGGNTGGNTGNKTTGGTTGGTQSGGSSSSVPNIPMPAINITDGRMQLANEYLRNLEARARMKINEVKMDENEVRAKKDFADYVTTLFASRRYFHVILAADFYRRLFDEGDYPVAMAQQVNVALESLQGVSTAVDVFRYNVSKNEIAGATSRLQEAFIACEFHPALMGLPRSEKEKVAQFSAKLSQLQNLVEARDFANLEKLLDQMKDMASDFDTTKATSLVNAIKLESKLRLGKAKLMAQQGNLSKAMEEFQAAAEAWPANPDLQMAAGGFFESQDFKTQSLTDFDRMVEEENFRGIYERQLAMAPAIKGDAAREDQFKSALEKVRKAEMASEKASLLMLNGDVYGAWETIELATADWPDDKKLNKLRAELSGKGADFVSAINKAREAEAKKETGYSLTWYVNAQRYYPASQIANQAIERLSKDLLNNGKG